MSTSPYCIYSYYTYGTNRSTVYRNNNIHDLPYVGATSSSTTNYISIFYGMYAYYNYGTTTNPFVIDKNTFQNIMVYNYTYTYSLYYNYVVNLTGNIVDNNRAYSNGSSYLYRIYYGSDYNITGNTSMNCKFGESGNGSGYIFYTYFVYNTNRTNNLFEDNVIKDNWAGTYFYGSYMMYYASWKINRNQIVRNMTSSSQGYFYAFYLYYMYNLEFTSNLIADNAGYYGNYNIYTYNYNSGVTADIRQNTLHYNIPSTGYPYHFSYGYVMQESQSAV